MCLPLALFGAEEPANTSNVDNLIKQLSDPKYAVREKASAHLWERGEEVLPKLRQAIRSDDPETVLRAADLLTRIDLRLTPQTDPQIVEVCLGYPKANIQDKSNSLRFLQQKRAWWQMLKLCSAETNAKLKRQYAIPMERVALFAAREHLAKGQVDEAWKVLKLAPSNDRTRLFLAELHRTEGSLAAELARVKDQPGPEAAAWRLALHRANGDFKAARREAAQAQAPMMEAAMAAMCGDPLPWLREVSLQGPMRHDPGSPVRNVYARLATRNWKWGTLTQDDFKALGPRRQDQHHFDSSYGNMMALLLLGRHETAELLMQQEDYYSVVRQLLAYERIGEIWKLLGVDPAKPCSAEWVGKRMLEYDENRGDPFDDADSQPVKELLSMAATLENRGMLELARASFVPPAMRLADKQQDRFLSMLSTLFSGNSTQLPAYQIATEIGTTWAGDDPKRWDTVLGTFFADNEFAQDWWATLTAVEPKASSRERLEGLFALLRLGPDPHNLRDLWMARTWKFCQKEDQQDRDAHLERLATLAFMSGEVEFVLKIWNDLPESLREQCHWRQRVMHLSAVERWSEIVNILQKRLEESAEDEDDLVSAAFHAYLAAALRRDGRLDKALHHDRMAERLSLGDPDTAGQIADAYAFGEDFTRSRAWRLRAISQMDPESGRYAQLAMEVCDELLLSPDDWQMAAAMAEIAAVLSVTDQYYRFEVTTGIAQLRLKADACRALASIRAGGDRGAAIAVLERCHKRFISDGELADFFFPGLQKVGLIKEHDEWFEQTWNLFRSNIDTYPQAWNTRNTAAWLAARAGRRLDEARALQLTVLEQFPQHPAYLDTMGEIEFARGNRRKALEWSRKGIAQAPVEVDLRRQFDHFKRDDPPR